MKYIYSTSQMSKLSLTLCTFSVTGSVAGLFLTKTQEVDLNFFFFPLSFLFYFQVISLYSIFRTRARVRVTRLCCHTAGHIR